MSILEAFLAGKEARRTADAAEQVNAMQQFIGQNGAAIMGGDPNALGQLAGFGQQGLQMAMGIQGDTQTRERQAAADAAAAEDRAYGRERDRVADQRADQSWEMKLEEYRKGLTAEQAAAEAAQMENAAKMALTATSPEQWDELARSNGADDLIGQFENREAVAAQFMSMADVLKATAPAEPAKPQTEVAQLKADLDAGLIDKATYDAEIARRAPKGTVIETLPDGTMRYSEGVGVEGRPAKPTEGSLASEGYLQRMKGAEDIFTAREQAGTTALGWTDRPVVDTALETLKLTGPEQQLLQAQRDWVRAKLRKESGAVIGPEEMAAEIKQYFPQPGEGADVINQKKAARKRAEEQLRITAMLPEDGSGSPGQDEIDLLMQGP
jgi:hypothetical protein